MSKNTNPGRMTFNEKFTIVLLGSLASIFAAIIIFAETVSCFICIPRLLDSNLGFSEMQRFAVLIIALMVAVTGYFFKMFVDQMMFEIDAARKRIERETEQHGQ